MNMEEAIIDKENNNKMKEHELVSLRKDIDNKKSEIVFIKKQISYDKKNLKLAKEKFKVNAEMQVIILDNYRKSPDKCDFLWEQNNDYWKYNRQLQIIMNKESELKAKLQIDIAKQTISKNIANLEIAKISLQMTQERLEGL